MTTKYRVLKDGMALKSGGVSKLDGIYERKDFASPDITFASRIKTGWLKEYVETYADIEANMPVPQGYIKCTCGNMLKIPAIIPEKKPEPTPEPEPKVMVDEVELEEENLLDPPPLLLFQLLPRDERGNMVEYWDTLPRLLDKEGKERRNVRQCPGCKKEYRSKSEILECCAE